MRAREPCHWLSCSRNSFLCSWWFQKPVASFEDRVKKNELRHGRSTSLLSGILEAKWNKRKEVSHWHMCDLNQEIAPSVCVCVLTSCVFGICSFRVSDTSKKHKGSSNLVRHSPISFVADFNQRSTSWVWPPKFSRGVQVMAVRAVRDLSLGSLAAVLRTWTLGVSEGGGAGGENACKRDPWPYQCVFGCGNLSRIPFASIHCRQYLQANFAMMFDQMSHQKIW